ncbi:type IV-A pilus assembly ATPase PilB, partial [Candidatus Kuenenbacteria bacterium]|nr:type IV-A pilus assembly ATPase PilB [Candidatus Kuenenbacteria bacterium]
QLTDAIEETKKSGSSVPSRLMENGLVKEDELLSLLSKEFGFPVVDLSEVDIPKEIATLIPKHIAQRHGIIPIGKEGNKLVVAVSDPSNPYAMDDIKVLMGFDVEPVISSESAISKAIEAYWKEDTLDDVFENVDAEDMEFLTGDGFEDEEQTEKISANVVRLVNIILVDAVRKRASDIHIEPYEKMLRVRIRIDGTLYLALKLDIDLAKQIISRIKILSSMDIAERRLPQDGRIQLKLGKNKEVDFRVSVLPVKHGEKAVLRILDKSALQLDMRQLGFEDAQLAEFKKAIHEPWGMVLVTGPTGSGKTTTLYSALMELNGLADNISTAEDPIEIDLEGVNQVQINDAVGLNFAATLRSFLRQDPDIIMVGEIRDFETAEIAIKAALTGHMVLSTLHTNDAPSTINRLLNMGIEPFLVISAVNLIIAQRLVRKICPECKQENDVPEQTLLNLGIPQDQVKHIQVFHGIGCKSCNQTGHKGRVALYEILPVSDEISECVLQGYSALELRREARRLGMKTLRESAVEKLLKGQISADEVLRVTKDK